MVISEEVEVGAKLMMEKTKENYGDIDVEARNTDSDSWHRTKVYFSKS